MDYENDIFIRKFELECCNKTLTLYQKQVGNVSCIVWDAALVLAKYLDISCQKNKFGSEWLRGKKILELGAGIGCVGMTAACLGGEVVMTDLQEALPILRKNIEKNKKHWETVGGSAEGQVLAWNKNAHLDFIPDIILLADCVYYEESILPLLDTLENFCNTIKDTYILLSQEERDTPNQISVWQKFMANLTERFKIENIALEEQHSLFSSSDIHLMKLTKIK
ncbi:protein-lysine methyltransferase METTL21D [Cephus cinctus]|uniref:Protein-lysine methyltransferase METTL21D n=1 Tax=Cephus cinctus TaxID=211228 RepID=A0AAJ7CBS1_CEPCN|nr:protein-lysine methyltransferase METTL21D [Cephus cinctus]XP_015606632.1 protein-lysine methyltransferase METTL21D [Cephus cinctus]XP_024946281.1 protein-lysine methyltransferase METTL21D [Cephus cinctus]